MNAYAVQDAWAKHAHDAGKRDARRQRESVELWARASAWVRRALPELVDGEPCPWAVAAAVTLRRTGRNLTRDTVHDLRARLIERAS